jgi:titin
MLENLESRTLLSASLPLVAPPVSVTAPVVSVQPPLVSALVGPTNLTQTVLGPTSIRLDWTNNDATAAGFWLFRSNDNITFTQVAKVASPTTSTYTDNSALPFHTYYYKVHVYTSAATSSPSNVVSATTPLGIPTGITAVAKSPTSLQVTWANSDASAAGYRVFRSTDGVNFSQVGTITSGATKTYLDTTNASSTAYTYKVQSYNGASSSGFSGTASATTPLITPTPFTAIAQSGSTIALSWTNLDPATTGYILQRSLNGTTFTPLATITDPTATTYTDSNLTSGRVYTYQLQATGALTPSAFTAKVAATTPLAAPSALSATTLTPTSIRLNWTINDPNAAGFTIMRSLDGVTFTQLAKTTTPAVATYTDTTALPFKTYTYKILDYTAAANSPYSNAASATTPLAIPANLAASVLSPTSIKLAWADTDAAAQGYQIFRSPDGVNYSQITTITSRTTLTFTDTVSSVSSYSYRVVAYNGSTTSANSNIVTAATPLGTPAGFAGAITGPTAIRLSWTSIDANATGMILQRSADGSAFVNLATLTDPTQLSYTDSAVMTGHTYAYKLQATKGVTTSAFTTAATVALPIAPPTNLAYTILGPTSVKLTWTNNDTSATGFWIFRSTDGVNFAQLIKVVSPATT